jgi:hypothetical protein
MGVTLNLRAKKSAPAGLMFLHHIVQQCVFYAWEAWSCMSSTSCLQEIEPSVHGKLGSACH